MQRASKGDFEGVRAPMEVYAFAGLESASDPRLGITYKDQVVQGVGLGEPERWSHLSSADLQALTTWVRRKAGALWVKGTPRTTVRGILHDCLTRGPPVRGPPIRLKGGGPPGCRGRHP